MAQSGILATLTVPVVADTTPLLRSLSSLRSALPGLLGLGGIGGLGAVGLGFGFAARQSVVLEKSLGGLAKATDLSGSELIGMRGALEQLAVRMKTVPVDQVYEIATAGAKAGIAAEDLIRYTEAIIKVSSAFDDMPVAQVADSIGKINGILDLGVGGYEQLGSAIDKVGDSGRGSNPEILEIVKRLASSGKQAGLTAQQMIALAGVMSDAGVHSEAAAGSLIEFVGALNTVKGRKGFADVLGVSAEEFAKTVRDEPFAAVQQFLAEINKLDELSQKQALGKIGVEGDIRAANITTLIAKQDELATYTRLSDEQFRTLSQSTESYARDAMTAEAAITQLWSQIRIAGRVIGDEMMPSILNLTSNIGHITERIPDIVDAFRTLGATDWAQSLTGGIWDVDDAITTLTTTVRNLDLIFAETGTKIGIELHNIKQAATGSFAAVGVAIDYLGQLVAGVKNPVAKQVDFGFANVDDFLEPIRAEMRAREELALQRKNERLGRNREADAWKAAPSAGGDFGPEAGAAGASGSAQPQILALADYFNKLQMGALSQKDPAERTARNTEKMAGGIQDIAKAVRNPAAGRGAAVVGPA